MFIVIWILSLFCTHFQFFVVYLHHVRCEDRFVLAVNFANNLLFTCLYCLFGKLLKIMSVNKVILIGNVGKEPEVRHLDRNMAVANVILATTERGYTLQNGTQVPERTEWHNVVLWGGLADVVERYVHKGDKLYIEGKIRTNTYEDQSGIRRYRTEILAENMEMLSSRPAINTQNVVAK